MKILKPPPLLKTMEVTCDNSKCGAVLEIDARDLKKESDDAMGFGSFYYTCPCCQTKRYRRPNEITPAVREDFTKLQ